MNSIELRDWVAALWPVLPILALFGSMLLGCLVTRNYTAPRVRKARLASRLQEVDALRAGEHLAVVGKQPTLPSHSGRVAEHIAACTEKAERLARHLQHAGVDAALIDESLKLYRHLQGLHNSLAGGTR